jgi:hydroxymethylbilane synthase
MTAIATVRMGTRGSRLALAQAAIAAEALAAVIGPVNIVPISTRGDAISLQRPRAGWVETDGQFTHDLESVLLGGEVDLAVHSFKDLPTAPVDGLVIGAVLARADARDCLVTRDGSGLEDLPFGAWIGTSSPRRAAQLATVRSDLIAMPIRGNVETRLRRLDAGEFDAILLAAAGLDRIGIPVAESARLPFDLMLPAPAQGALAVQLRSDATRLRGAVIAADHGPTRVAVEAERALLRQIGGGCLAPLGALGEVSGGQLRLRAAYEDADGVHHRAEGSGALEQADAVVEAVASAVRSA